MDTTWRVKAVMIVSVPTRPMNMQKMMMSLPASLN